MKPKAQETRGALGQSVAKTPDEATQARHRLTRVLYANWCKKRSEHRARPDHRERTDGVKRGSIPEVSFDFCYARARDSETKSARAVCRLVAIDSQTGFFMLRHWEAKVMNFSQLSGYSAITYRSASLGLTTRLGNLKLGDHSFLSETQLTG